MFDPVGDALKFDSPFKTESIVFQADPKLRARLRQYEEWTDYDLSFPEIPEQVARFKTSESLSPEDVKQILKMTRGLKKPARRGRPLEVLARIEQIARMTMQEKLTQKEIAKRLGMKYDHLRVFLAKKRPYFEAAKSRLQFPPKNS